MTVKRVLSLGVAKVELSSVSTSLADTTGFEVEEAPTSRSALTLADDIRFDLVVVAHPRSDLEPERFLDRLRGEQSASRDAKVILVTEDPNHSDLTSLRQHAFEIVSRRETLLGDLTSKALEGDPRVPISVMVRLSAELPYGRSIRICQSENLSISGMLIRTEDTLPVGTLVETEFCLPGESEPIEAQAQVVRLTVAGEIPGIALNFERIPKHSHRRLESFLGTTH